ncbi:non-ribosomal peptide synthetase [Staphylococcus epidermidis]|uniref:non-ribosomal peptide synthetase n=1 Tax=Staphylococcus epidermidis TaxID=1282 RepID=UPI001DA7991F|nr:non-ribosomal peptide synthetase [Staphylococcus epidermidis]MBM0838686.1 amino acid adenylation domain-containing protein [Staphylococcus epidermidis]
MQQNLLNDANVSLIIVENEQLKEKYSEILSFNLSDLSKNEENLDVTTSIEDPAYIIYTSGSTGNPKGVKITNRGPIKVFRHFQHYNLIKQSDNFPQFSTVSFDAACLEIYTTLLSGATLFIPTIEEKQDPHLYEKFLNDNNITLALFPPAYANQLNSDNIKTLEILITGGSATNFTLINNWNDKVRYFNVYGPTENSIISTIWEPEPSFKEILIGKPLTNDILKIVNDKNQILPPGIPGEILLGGMGLMKEYVNLKDLTKQQIIKIDGKDMYKTGDIGLWDDSGNVKYLGRVDDQVKIRGFRIELQEIEKNMEFIDGVVKAHVISEKNNNQNEIVAYFISENECSSADIKKALSFELPSYMIPTHIFQIEKFPVNHNGKIDNNKLPKFKKEYKGEEFKPKSEKEKIVSNIWKEVLSVDKIYKELSFYDLGGDSIKAIQVTAKLRQYGMSLKVSSLLEKPFIEELSKKIDYIDNNNNNENDIGRFPISPVQSWFLDSDFNKDYFNQSILIKLESGITIEKVKYALNQIIENHNVLRSAFYYNENENNTIQVIKNKQPEHFFELHSVKINEKSEMEIKIKEAQKLVDFKANKFIVGLFVYNEQDNEKYLFLTIHHLLIDLVSWRIILDDIANILDNSYDQNNYWKYPSSSYESWVKNLYNYPTHSEKYLWKSILQQKTDPIDIDTKAQLVSHKNDIDYELVLDKQLTQDLLYYVNQAYNTNINHILLATLSDSLWKWKQVQKVLINLESHGRDDFNENINNSRTVGWFTSQYPIILEKESNIENHLINIKDTLNRIPYNGMGYGIGRYINQEDTSNYSADISFNYFGKVSSNKYPNFSVIKLPDSQDMDINNIREFKLNIYGYQEDDTIILKFNFSDLQFHPENIKQLTKYFEESLKTFISLCKGQKDTKLTVSDLQLVDIDSKTFEVVKKDTAHLGNIEDIYPLTPMQKGMLYHNQKEAKDPYYDQMWFDILGELDINLIKQEIESLLNETDALKTNVYENQFINQPLQVITTRKNKVIFEDLSLISHNKAKQKIQLYLLEEKDKNINLYKDNLITIKIYKLADEKYKVILSFHHFLMDGWSVSLFINKLLSNYEKSLNNIPKEKVPQFKEYLSYLKNKDTKIEKDFWNQYLENFETHTRIPYEVSENVISYKPHRLEFNIGLENTNKLKEIANINNITLNALMNTIWGVLLQQYNNSKDIVFGTVVSGRSIPLESIDKMIGLLINTVPIRVNSNKSDTFIELAKKVNEDLYNIKDKETYPLYEIQNISHMKENLVSHIFLFENQPTSKNLKIGNLKICNFDGQEQTNYNFNVKVIPSDNMKIQFDYNVNAIAINEAKKIKEHLINILNSIVEHPNISIRDISYIDSLDKKQWYLLNNTHKERSFFTVPQLFDNIAKQYSQCDALAFNDKTLTYKELDEFSNKIANLLLENGINKNSFVPVITSKNIFTVSSIIAILKLGATYVPIDNSYPDERKEFILSDINAKIILTSSEKHKVPNSIQYTLLNISKNINWDQYSSTLMSPNISGDTIAYIIYTSGTTGTPKGVKITHSNITNLNVFFSNNFNMSEKDNVAQFANLSFDASLWEIFSALLNGGTLVIPNEDEAIDYNLFEKFVNKRSITTLSLTPAFATYLTPENLPSLKKVVTSGSASSKKLAQKWKEHVLYFNGYGPTENTICTTMWLANDDFCSKTVPIGKPIPNNRIYILNHNNQIQPIGVPGEICIAGENLSSGYLNKEDITRQKFVYPQNLDEKRIYYTGDIAKLLPDGNIEFIGRKDDQIKIRGFRVEVGEVEESLVNIPSIKEAVVIPYKDDKGNVYLCAYYISFDRSMNSKNIKNTLQEKLPNFMIPSFFVKIESMPYTHNGKIDKSKLSDIKNSSTSTKEIVNISTPTQAILKNIWEESLMINNLQLDANLFNEGLHSIKILEGISKIENILKVDIRYNDIIENPTILELESKINHIQNNSSSSQNAFSLMSQGNKTMFAFPTGLGLGITFNELSNYMRDTVSLYTTDFDDSNQNYAKMIDSYINDMYDINGDNPYTILGYCAGGNLSFELVKRMEEKGLIVEKLILLDTTIRNPYINEMFKDKSYLDDAQNHLPYWANNTYTQKRFSKFKNYLDQLNNKGTINSNIYHIRVPSETDEYKNWKGFTNSYYKEYRGAGTHDTLLDITNVYENYKIIMSIINHEDGEK